MKKFIFLGGSVTFGYGSIGVSFADYLEKTDGIVVIKEAVPMRLSVSFQSMIQPRKC